MTTNGMLVLLQDAQQVTLFYELGFLQKAQYIIPLTPDACWACQKKDIAYEIFDKLIDQGILYSHKKSQLDHNMKWLSYLDEFLQKEIEVFASLNFQPAQLYILGLFGFLDELFTSSYILTTIFKKLAPAEVVYQPISAPAFGEAVRVMPRVLLCQYILEDVAKFHQIKITVLQTSSNGILSEEIEKRECSLFDNLLEKCSSNLSEFKFNPIAVIYRVMGQFFSDDFKWEYKLFKLYRKEYIQALWHSMVHHNNQSIFMLGGGFELAPLTIELRKNGCKPIRVDNPTRQFGFASNKERESLQQCLVDAWHKIIDTMEFKAPFLVANVTLSSPSLDIIKRWWFEIIPNLWFVYRNINDHFDRKKYSSVISWALGEDTSGPIVAVARGKAIPTFCYQHGGSLRGMWEINTLQELFKVDYYFTYGLGTNKLFQHAASKLVDYGNQGMLIPVGSARLDQLAQLKKPSAKKIARMRRRMMRDPSAPLVLYIPTVFEHSSKRLRSPELHGVEYFEFQQKLLALFNEFNQYEFIYKGFPGRLDVTLVNPIQEYISQLCGANFHYFTNVLAHELMWLADLVIIDHLQTAIIELLLTNKKIIALNVDKDNGSVSNSYAINLLKQRVCLAENQNDFFQMVTNVLSDGDFSPTLDVNNTFLQEYGTYQNDHLSVKRAAAHVIKYSTEQVLE